MSARSEKRGSSRARSDRRAFTLVECAVSIAIIAIVLSIVSFGFRRAADHFILWQTTVQVEQDLLSCRQLAVSTEQPWTVRFAPWSPFYDVYRGTTWIRRVRLPASIAYAGGRTGLGQNDVNFDYDGGTHSGGRVSLQDEEHEVMTIMIYPITGEISRLDG